MLSLSLSLYYYTLDCMHSSMSVNFLEMIMLIINASVHGLPHKTLKACIKGILGVELKKICIYTRKIEDRSRAGYNQSIHT